MRSSVLGCVSEDGDAKAVGYRFSLCEGSAFVVFVSVGRGRRREKTNLDTRGIHLGTGGVAGGEDVAIAQRFSAFGPSVLLRHHSPSVPFRVVLEWCLTDRWGTDIEFGDDGILAYYNISQRTKKKGGGTGGTYKVLILRPLYTPLA